MDMDMNMDVDMDMDIMEHGHRHMDMATRRGMLGVGPSASVPARRAARRLAPRRSFCVLQVWSWSILARLEIPCESRLCPWVACCGAQSYEAERGAQCTGWLHVRVRILGSCAV
jgi:hypothetical protein